MKQLYMFKALLIACIMIFFGGGNFALAQTTETVIIWSEDWSFASNGQLATNVTNDNATYSVTNSGSTVYTTGTMSAGGKSPELLIKANDSWTVKIKDLKGCTGDLTLTYKSNRTSPTLTVTANDNTVKMSSTSTTKEYTGTITLSETDTELTLVFKATSNSRIDDVVLTGTTTGGSGGDDPTKMTLSFGPKAGEYPAAQNVTLTSSVDGATLYYTTNGDEPTTESAKYTAAIPVTISGTTIKALAVADGYENATAEAAYTIKPDQPKFSEESKTFKDPLAVTLTLPETASAGAKIHYAIGGTATAESDVYDGTPITISGEKIILHAVVVDEYGNVGTEKYCTYTYSDAIIFDFTANPNVWGIEPASGNGNTKSNTDGQELEVSGVVLTTASGTGTYKTCIYGTSSYALRMYKDGSITLTAPANYEITSVTFTGSSLNNLKEETTGTAVSTTNNKWEGSAQAITFVAPGSCQIKTISVTLKKMPATGTFTFTAQDAEGNYYATFSTDHYIVFPEEVELSVVNGINEDGTLKYFVKTPDETPVTDEVGSVKGSLVPKNTGVLLKSSKAEVTYYFPTSDVTGSIISWFKPVTNEDGTFEGREGYKYYKLAYDNYADKTGLGFYWGAENGAPFKSKKGLAVLEVPETTTSGAAPTHFLIGGGTDGISNVKSDVKADKDGVIYNIAGQRVNAATKPGLYIIGGKKVVVK